MATTVGDVLEYLTSNESARLALTALCNGYTRSDMAPEVAREIPWLLATGLALPADKDHDERPSDLGKALARVL